MTNRYKAGRSKRNKNKPLHTGQLKAIVLLVSKDVHGMKNYEIAEEVGVSSKTLQQWKHIPEFNDEMIRQAEEIQRAFLVDTYNELRQMVTKTGVQDKDKLKAIELMLKNQGRLKDVQEVKVTEETKSIDEMLDEIDNL